METNEARTSRHRCYVIKLIRAKDLELNNNLNSFECDLITKEAQGT